MIGKVISGGSFGGTVGYVMKEQSRVLEARGVEPPGVREMVEDFEDQARLNPRLQQNVGHISLSFSPKAVSYTHLVRETGIPDLCGRTDANVFGEGIFAA